MNLLLLVQILLIPASSYLWLAIALLTKRTKAKTYTAEFGSIDDTNEQSSSVKLVPDFDISETILDITFSFNGQTNNANTMQLYLIFETA